jgi:hypothetical protein
VAGFLAPNGCARYNSQGCCTTIVPLLPPIDRQAVSLTIRDLSSPLFMGRSESATRVTLTGNMFPWVAREQY